MLDSFKRKHFLPKEYPNFKGQWTARQIRFIEKIIRATEHLSKSPLLEEKNYGTR